MTHPVDVHVGKRVKEIRAIRSLTQSDVARHLDISFQQLQKYESGSNRISASRLYELATLLGVSPGYFFDGLMGEKHEYKQPLDVETARLALAISSISDERLKSHLHTFIHEIARCSASSG